MRKPPWPFVLRFACMGLLEWNSWLTWLGFEIMTRRKTNDRCRERDFQFVEDLRVEQVYSQ